MDKSQPEIYYTEQGQLIKGNSIDLLSTNW